LLLVLAVAFLAPALRQLSSNSAQQGKDALQRQLRLVMASAQATRETYTIRFIPTLGRIRVTRWALTKHGTGGRPVATPVMLAALPHQVVIERIDIPTNECVITKSGFILNTGSVVLHAPDGSRASVRIDNAGGF
jgi:hypothetical protein